MSEYGIWSLLPPVIAIILAIRTRQVYVALLFGIWMGWMIISDWNPVTGTLASIQALVDVFREPGNTRTIMFSALVGALIIFIQRSGGVQGFILLLEHVLERFEGRNNRVIVQVIATCIGILVFVESSISVLTVGTLFRPVFDKMRISREKLAYLSDSSSAPICILIPLNAWGAFVMGLLLTQGFERPFSTMVRSIPYNFYPVLAIVLVFIVIFSRRDIGPMAKAEQRTRDTGKLHWDDAIPMVSDELTEVKTKAGIIPRARNMVIPIAIMVCMMPLMLIYTGWDATSPNPVQGHASRLVDAIGEGSGSTSVLVSVIVAILFSMVSYRVQGLFKLKELVDLTMKGISGLMPLALLMLMAFAISNVCKELHTGEYVADITSAWLSPNLVPFLIFLVSGFIAFATGTSWGTFGIMIAIAIPMAQSMDANTIMTIAAVLGGGVFGDHCSPISDTTIIASMASATDHIDHVRTQLPYALLGGTISALLYLLFGVLG